ncbi:MAG: hypothetical protein JWN34_5875 [Bryobacterales bacterium]|nr:hypothetical protein [Bryobacterales bacterium]
MGYWIAPGGWRLKEHYMTKTIGMMYFSLLIAVLSPGVCRAQSPSISPDGVVPLFSKANPDNSIQPGSWVSIYGKNLAGGISVWKGDFPTSLGGTSVKVNGKPAYLWFVSPGQINLQAPDDTAAATVYVEVTTGAGVALATVNLRPFAPAFSLLDSTHVTGIILRPNGSGASGGGSYDILGPTGSSLGYPTVAAAPGDNVVLFGIGFGPTTPAVPAGRAFAGTAPLSGDLNLLIQGTVVKPAFIGLSSAGLYQINLTLPTGLGTGDVPLIASNGNQTQPGVVISLQNAPIGPHLQSLTLTSGSVVGGSAVTGTVALSGAAPAGGGLIALTSSSGVATVPASVTIPAGATSAAFSVTTSTVIASQTVTIGASSGGASRQVSLTVTPATAIYSLTQTISPGQSTTFTLPDGSSVTIPSGAVQAPQAATLSLLETLPAQPPGGLVVGVGRVLRLSIAAPAVPAAFPSTRLDGPHATAAPSPDLQFNLNVSQTTAAGLNGAVGMVQLAVSQLTSLDLQPVSLGVLALIDRENRKTTGTVPGAMLDSYSVFNGNATATFSVANWSRDLTTPATDGFGPRQWDPTSNRWTTYPLPGYDPSKKTCVLVHGINSNVEGAFPDGSVQKTAPGCDQKDKPGAVSRIAAASGCQQVLGFNYRWGQKVDVSGADLGRFLASTGLKEVTVVAHSLGGVVSVAALGGIPESQIKVTNLVTLGSPHLGTSAAVPANVLSLLAMVTNPYAALSLGSLYASANALDTTLTGFTTDVAPGSTVLSTNMQAFAKAHPNANVVALGGVGTQLGVLTDKWIFGTASTDGIVNTVSALCAGCPFSRLSSTTIPVNHLGLACDQRTVDFIGAKLANPPPPSVILTVNVTGPGVVTLDKAGPTYTAGTQVKLTETPNPGAAFTGWSGACTGTGTTCTVTMNSDVVVNANFKAQFALSVVIAGSGGGTVAALPGGFSYAAGQKVTLTAQPNAQSTFAGWGSASGACVGTALTCPLTVTADDIITATFNLKQFTLAVNTAGTGAGTVALNRTGPYAPGTVVAATATAGIGSTFAGWSGACSGTGACNVTMNANATLTATFTLTSGGGTTGSLSGVWTGTWTYPFGSFCAYMTNAMTWNLTQNGSTVNGTYSYVVTAVDPEGFCPNAVGDRQSGNLGNGIINGSTLTFDTFGNRGFTGAFTSTKITGTGGTSSQTTGPFTLTRQ